MNRRISSHLKHINRNAKGSIIVTTALSIICASLIFGHNGSMGDVWTFPYFSAARNYEQPFVFKINPNEFEIVKNLPQIVYRKYKHKKSSQPQEHRSSNSFGYVYIAMAGQQLLPWLGDLESAAVIQLVTHIAICILFLHGVFDTQKSRIIFFILYAVNPLVIRYVTFPFYYFWICIPAALLAAQIIRKDLTIKLILFGTPLILLSIMIRPTTLVTATFFYMKCIYDTNYSQSLPRLRTPLIYFCFSIFIAGVLTINKCAPRGLPWHTMFIGTGGYGDSGLAKTPYDSEGFSYFFNKTNIKVDPTPITGNYYRADIKTQYNELLKHRYLQWLNKNLDIGLKNAVLNFGQLYSVGYITASRTLSILSSILGWGICLFLMYKRKYIWIIAIFSTGVMFFWYFPPIPVYNYASYILLASALAQKGPEAAR